jgi:hypothetical protein
MSRRTRRIVALIALCVAVSMALGVGGYSSASAERSVSVSVVDDESAYLGVPGGTLHCGRNTIFYNQFPEPVTGGHVGVTPNGDHLVLRHDGDFVEAHEDQEVRIPIEEDISAGKQFRIQLKPINDSAHSVTIDIELNGSSFSVSTTETRYVACEKRGTGPPADQGHGPPANPGNGPAEAKDGGDDENDD